MQNRNSGDRDLISVMLVDDIPEVRENIKKMLSFEDQEFKVVGSVGTGRDAIDQAQKLRPDIVIMDINLPDMDGIRATNEITQSVPSCAVIMMSVQSDADYLKKAMQAGARYFLSKPVGTDELYGTIREVYRNHAPFRMQAQQMMMMPADMPVRRVATDSLDGSGVRAGHIIVVYSPQGGVGVTTIATNLASGLMKKNIKVLLVDADLQFGDVGVFLKLQSQSTLADLVGKIDDLDTDFFDSVVSTHESGLKVLLGLPRPEFYEELEQDKTAVSRILEKVADGYDFIVVDTSTRLDESLLALTDIADKIVMVATPTLACIKNSKFMLDIFDKMEYPPDKVVFMLNRVEDERSKTRVTLPSESIERHLKRKIEAKIPSNEATILAAVNRGVPVVANQRDRKQSPVKELVEFADHMFTALTAQPGLDDAPAGKQQAPAKKSGIGLRLGKG